MLDKIIRLENNLEWLHRLKEKLKSDSPDENFFDRALRYALLESIQIIIDISCHICGKFYLGNPESYSDCIKLLENYDYIPKTLSVKLQTAVSVRVKLWLKQK